MEKEIFEQADIENAIDEQDAIIDEQAQAEQAAEMQQQDFISADDFFNGFKGAFGVASICFNSEALKIADDETGARLLSDKIYNLFLNNPFFWPLLRNGGLMAFDWALIITWAFKKTNDVITEKTGKTALEVVSEKAGKGFVSGVLSKFKFWGRK